MTYFIKRRDKLSELLLSCGLAEINHSKACQPEQLPAGIVSLANRQGDTKIDFGYDKYKFKVEIHLVVEDDITADVTLLELVEKIDSLLQDKMSITIDSVDFYDSLLNAKSVKIAKFEVIL